MPLENIIDIEALLKPISDDSPHGIDIREDPSPTSSYYRIKDARNAGRAAEKAAILDPDADIVSPWQTVIAEAITTLESETKDIEVTCWLIEAMIRLNGYQGLRDGFVLLDKLIDQYWDNLYPEPDEDGIETKVIPITGLNGESGEGTLLTPMRNALLSDPYSDTPFTYWEYQQAHAADKIGDAKAKAARFEELGYSLSGIESSILSGDSQYFTQFVETLEEAQNAYQHLGQTLRKHCGHDTPPSSNINNLLNEVLSTCKHIFKDKLIVAAPEAPIEAASTAAPSQAQTGAPTTMQTTTVQVAARDGVIIDREDALKRLTEVAEYFRRYEPHTPIGPGIERLIKWGRMNVAELMMELLPDSQAKGIFSQLTGVALDGSDNKAYAPPPPKPASSSAPASSSPAPAAEAPAPPAEPAQKSGW